MQPLPFRRLSWPLHFFRVYDSLTASLPERLFFGKDSDASIRIIDCDFESGCLTDPVSPFASIPPLVQVFTCGDRGPHARASDRGRISLADGALVRADRHAVPAHSAGTN